MKKKHNWTFKSKHVFAAMILVCISLMIFAAAVKFPVDAVRTAAGYIIVPFQKGINAVGTALDGATAGIQDKQKLVKEKKKLQKKVDELTAENSRLTQSISELERLQELYQLDQDYSQYDKVAANVISMDTGNWFANFTINKGTKDGVQKDCNVIAGSGLVGIVTEAGSNWATVRSIIDDSSNVSAMTVSTDDTCVIEGDLELIDEGKLRFSQLYDREDKVSVGERIVTSNISEKYVEGLFIGYVSEIELDTNNLTKTGTIVTPVDFQHLKDVFVITVNKEDAIQGGAES